MNSIFSSPELTAQVSFSDRLLSVVRLSVRLSICKPFTFSSSYSEPLGKFQTKHHPCVMKIQVCSNEGSRPFPRGDNNRISKIHRRNLQIFFSRTTKPISTKLGTKHPWVTGIQVCSNEWPRPFPRGNKYKIVKLL